MTYSLEAMHPELAQWFSSRFGQPTDVQLRAWAAIGAGQHTLIAAPTGSGKTLAALMPCLDQVVRDKLADPDTAKSGVRILYITPLKALNNDIHHHAVNFVQQLASSAADSERWPAITVGVRTGDTPQSARNRMLRKPPDMLVTTPESLYLLLTSVKGREMLRSVQHLIVDEIHDLAADRRGSHLSLSLERLTERCEQPPQRIGVSATQKPIERIAQFLGGWEASGAATGVGGELLVAQLLAASNNHPLGYRPRLVDVIESAMPKAMELSVTMPDPATPAKGRDGVWIPLMDRILRAMEGCRSVLVFVNSRRLAERLVLRLNDYVGYEMARSHHGSLAREKRLEVERMLKDGELRCLIATSSLELGIDVGHIDRVIQIDSPLNAASGIQRIGRAGHSVGDTANGIVIARHRGALPEIAVLARQIRERDIEAIRPPLNALDVLSQQVTAMVAMDDWHPDALHRLIARSDSYHTFPRERLDSMLQVLAGYFPFVRPLIDWDRTTGWLRKRGVSMMSAVSGAGTIPSSSNYPVHHVESRAQLGELDEEYVHESRVGDVFQLGTHSWMIREISHDRLYVSEATNRLSEIPFWKAEPGSRSFELGERIGQFLTELIERLKLGGPPSTLAQGESIVHDKSGTLTQHQSSDQGESETKTGSSAIQPKPISLPAAPPQLDTIDWLQREFTFDAAAAEQLISLVRAQHAASRVPTHRRIVIEYFRDTTDQTHVIVHTLWGRRFNRTWLMALERQFDRLLPYRIYGAAKDNGIEFVMPEWDRSWLHAIWQVTSANLESLLLEAIPGSPQLPIAFRHIAETSLLLSRSYGRTPLWQKRIRSEELLKEAVVYADQFPFLREAMDRSLYEELDVARVKQVLDQIAEGEIEVDVVKSEFPSPFAGQFLSDYISSKIYEGDSLGADLQLQLLSLNKELAGELFGADSIRQSIEPAIVEAERARLESSDRMPESDDDLWKLLKRRGDMTADELRLAVGPAYEQVEDWTRQLLHSGRISRIALAGEERYICSDEQDTYTGFPESAASRVFILNRYIENVIAFRTEEFVKRFGLSAAQCEAIISHWLQEERIEAAPFAAPDESGLWTSRKIASRIVRLSIRELRKQAEPTDPARWCAAMITKHRLDGGEPLRGTDGLRTVIGQLQGLFLPLPHWESIILPSRITDYRKEDLDLLCASGEVVWIGKKEPGEKEGRIAFFLAEAKELYAPYVLQREQYESSPADPELYDRLRNKGASFLTALSRELDRRPSELLDGLIELVWQGLASNDQFAPMRLHARTAGSRARTLEKTGSGLGRWYAVESLADDNTIPADETAVRWAHHLLEVQGVVTKESVSGHIPVSWDTMVGVFKQLEEWGLVTRGMFIRDVPSLQFATKEWAASLRQSANRTNGSWTLLNSVDPANPYGLAVPWPDVPGAAFARKPGNYIVMDGERWLFWIERYGRKITVMDSNPATNGQATGANNDSPNDGDYKQLTSIFRTLIRRHRLSKVVIESWNGRQAANTDVGRMLTTLGAERDRDSLVFWPSTLK